MSGSAAFTSCSQKILDLSDKDNCLVYGERPSSADMDDLFLIPTNIQYEIVCPKGPAIEGSSHALPFLTFLPADVLQGTGLLIIVPKSQLHRQFLNNLCSFLYHSLKSDGTQLHSFELVLSDTKSDGG